MKQKRYSAARIERMLNPQNQKLFDKCYELTDLLSIGKSKAIDPDYEDSIRRMKEFDRKWKGMAKKSTK